MKPLRHLFAVLMLLGMMFAATAAVSAQGDPPSSPPAAKAGTDTLTVHWRMCEEIPINGDWFGSCHHTPQQSQKVTILKSQQGESADAGDRITQQSDDSGNATFNVTPGRYQVEEVPGDFLEDSMLFCSTLETPGVRVASPIAIGAGENYLCDYYFVGSNAKGEVTPPPVSSQTRAYHAAIYYGNCVPGPFVDPIMTLMDATTPDGDVVGATGGVPAYVSFSHSFQDFDTLLAKQSVVAVFDPANPQMLVACGYIGGIYGKDGSLTLTLYPVKNSGVSGVAYLRPGTNSSLSVTLYLIEVSE
ncbi:MAG: hypothetical protein ACR2OU_20395 [Thermomicrobiales bacterium]